MEFTLAHLATILASTTIAIMLNIIARTAPIAADQPVVSPAPKRRVNKLYKRVQRRQAALTAQAEARAAKYARLALNAQSQRSAANHDASMAQTSIIKMTASIIAAANFKPSRVNTRRIKRQTVSTAHTLEQWLADYIFDLDAAEVRAIFA